MIEFGEDPAVVLIYGAQAWSYAWRYQIGPLAAAGFRAIVPDLPGSSYSDISRAADYSISALNYGNKSKKLMKPAKPSFNPTFYLPVSYTIRDKIQG